MRCIDHDPSRALRLGTTSYGTPVDIFEEVVKADKRILLGNIEYHYFAGYSGGAKALMPGVSTRAAIQANHSRMVDENNAAGRLSGNEVRADIEEATKFISADFILNRDLAQKMFFTPFRSAQEALDTALIKHPDAKIIVMPYGGATLSAVIDYLNI